MPPITRHLGVDVAKASLRIALLHPDGSWSESDVPNNASGFAKILSKLGSDPSAAAVCLESTGVYGDALCAFLHSHGVPVAAVNPRLVRDYARSLNCRTKNDPVDARIIARYSLERRPVLWSPPETSAVRLRELLSRRDDLLRMNVAERNRLESASASAKASIREHADWLADHIVAIDREIAAFIEADPLLRGRSRLLRSIPGIGAQTAARLLAFIDMNRFANARSLAAHAGVTPAERDSGTSVHGRPRMSKIGHPQLRRALYMPALSARRGAGFRAWADRLKAAGKPPRLILGAVMHRLLRVAFGVLKSGEPYSPSKAFALS